jgi:hypothetical protein
MGVMVLPVGRSRIQIVCSRAIAHAMQWNHILAQGEMTAQSSVKQLYFLGLLFTPGMIPEMAKRYRSEEDACFSH